jgi:uncharacterized repeat protein (TIGR01451 family)
VFGTLDAGTSASIAFTVVPTVAGVMDDLAVAQGFVNGTFTTTQIDLQTPVSTPTTPPTVAASSGAPDLQISGSTNTGRPAVGTTFLYTFQVKNGGNQTALGATVSDALPATLSYVGAGTNRGTCTHDADTVSCSLGDLAVGAQAVVQIAASAPAAGAITNGATVADTNGDSKPSNNLVDLSVQVQ